MSHTLLMLHLHTVTLFDQTLTCAEHDPLLTWHLCYPFNSILEELGFAAISGLISIANATKMSSF